MKGKERAKSSIDKDVESGCSLELWFFFLFGGILSGCAMHMLADWVSTGGIHPVGEFIMAQLCEWDRVWFMG